MRVLCDLKHPADVHFFRPLITALRRDGDEVLVTSRAKDETLELLDGLGMSHVCVSSMGQGLAGMGAELIGRTVRLVGLARRFRPDVMIARTGVCVALVGRALRVPAVTVDDTEFAWLQVGLSTALATLVCTGMGYGRRFPGKQEWFNAPPQLAYTHRDRFAPDPGRLRTAGLDPAEPYVVVRLKAWRAVHDMGAARPEEREAVRLIETLARRCRVVLSAERAVPPELAPYRNPVPVEDALHLLAFAHLYVGEGSSMAAEAACLGVPAIYISPNSRRGYLDALEQRFGHVRTVRNASEALRLAEAWLSDPTLRNAADRIRGDLARSCDDPVIFLRNVLRRQAHRR